MIDNSWCNNSPCNNSHPNIVSHHGQFFDELNSEGFDFSNGFKCNDVHKFEKLKNLSINIFEINFYRDQNKWKQKLIPIEINKNETDRVIDLLIYNNHYVFIKKFHKFSGNHNCNYFGRRGLNSYTSQNVSSKHKQQCEERDY